MRLVNCQAAANVGGSNNCLQMLPATAAAARQTGYSNASAVPLFLSLHSLSLFLYTLALSLFSFFLLCFVCWPKQLKTWQRASNLIEQVRQQVDNTATKGQAQG